MLSISPVAWALLLAVSGSPALATKDAITMSLDDAALLQPHNVSVTAVSVR